MIRSLKIEGYENHINSELEFVNGLNIISGASHMGKSSIVKALNFLINNEPSGEGFINHDLQFCKVECFFEKDKIVKYKDKKEHYYEVNDNDKNRYSALNQNVPKQINEITLFTEMNCKKQFDKFFLLQSTSGEVARKLNKIINLSIMDEAIKQVKSKVIKKNRDIQYLENEVIELKEAHNKYNWLDNVEDIIKDIELKDIELNNLTYKLSTLNQYASQLFNININLKKYKNIDKLKKLTKKVKNSYEKYDLLQKKLFLLQNIEKELKNIEKELKNYENIEKYKIIFKKIMKNYEKFEKNQLKIEYLQQIIKINDDISQFNLKISKLNDKYKELLNNFDICPFCKQKIRSK